MCVCVRKEKEAEEKDGKGDKVETAASDGKSAVVGEAAIGDNATEIVDKSQVVFFLMLHCGVHRHSQTVQLSDSAIAVFTATLRALLFCCYACPSAVSTAA